MNCTNCGRQRGILERIFSGNERGLCRECLKVHDGGLEEYKKAILDAVSDGKVTGGEASYLDGLTKKYFITEQEKASTRLGAYHRVYEKAVEDRALTVQEQEQLSGLQKDLGIDDAKIGRQLSGLARLQMLRESQEGRLPVLPQVPLLLKKGEVGHWMTDAEYMEERVVSRRYEGGSRGVSIRIMKGVSYRVGAHKGQLVTETGIVTVDSGQLILTSQRVAFTGARKSFNVPYKQLMNFNLFDDGVQINKDGKSKPQIFKIGDVDLFGSFLTTAARNFNETN